MVVGCLVLAQIFIQLHMSFVVWIETTIAYVEVGVICSGFRDDDDASKVGVVTMTHVCCLGETLFGGECVWYLCVPLGGVMVSPDFH